MAKWKGSRFSGLLRVVRVRTADGETVDAPDGEVTEQPGDARRPTPAADIMKFKPVEFTVTGTLSPGTARWLRYMTHVRPWLYCPVEQRLN